MEVLFKSGRFRNIFAQKKSRKSIFGIALGAMLQKILHGQQKNQKHTVRGNKKVPKVNGHISTANKRIPEIFFLQPPQYYQVFFEHIFYTRLHPQAKIFKHFHARRISKMVKNVPLTSKIQI